MKKRQVLIASVLAGISLILVACGNKDEQKGFGNQIQNVNTTAISVNDFTIYNSYPTSLEGIETSEARSKVTGYITEVLVDEGQRVRKGQLLFKLETSSLNEEAAAAKANISAAQVQVDQLVPLVDKGIVSQSQLEAAKAKLAQAKASYSAIQANIGYANVVSPVDGYVGEVRIRKGNLVSPADPMPLTVVSDISKVYAYFTMNEKDYLNFIKKAEGATIEEKIENLPKVKLTLANGDEYPYEGTIQTVNSQVDKRTGSISFRAVFDNPERILTNGSSGSIQIPQSFINTLYVPRKSTFELQGVTYVFGVTNRNDSTFLRSEPISILHQTADFYLVDTVNLKKGSEIVVEGVDRLRDKMPVKANLMPLDSAIKELPVLFYQK